ncbi:MAG: sigma-70 family RNA polymerase sigma factor [Firmicutes bacterium]|nr:sigma-70 family RNA polymerase sigma factor [Bacillota bacterium]
MNAREFNECLKNEKGITKIFHEYYPKLVLSALKFFRCRSLAEDIAQEVMLKLIEILQGVCRKGEDEKEKSHPFIIKNPDAYLSILVKNISLNKKKKDAKMEFASDMALEVETKQILDDEIKKWDFEKLFNSLSHSSKQIYKMHYEDDLSIKTIAKELNLKEGTIKWKLHKLREEARRKVKDEW